MRTSCSLRCALALVALLPMARAHVVIDWRPRPSAAEVQAAVEPVLAAAALHYNTSYSFGWADGLADQNVGFMAGAGLNDSCSVIRNPSSTHGLSSNHCRWP